MSPNVRTDFLKLHFIILLWGFTAVLGELIELPSVEVVFIRSGVTAVAMAAMGVCLTTKTRRDAILFAANGALIGLHWVLFFAAVKVANVSVCMVGMATVSLWTALLEPMMVRGFRVRTKDIVLGLVIIAAVVVIVRGDAFQTQSKMMLGLGLAIVAAIIAAVFSIVNAKFVDRASPQTIVTYEMLGACLACGTAMLLSMLLEPSVETTYRWPSLWDGAWMTILVWLCTIHAYTQYIELLNRMTVFTINFANNMEPIYGIILGALIFRDHEQVDGGFYVGAMMIAVTVALQPWIDRDRKKS